MVAVGGGGTGTRGAGPILTPVQKTLNQPPQLPLPPLILTVEVAGGTGTGIHGAGTGLLRKQPQPISRQRHLLPRQLQVVHDNEI